MAAFIFFLVAVLCGASGVVLFEEYCLHKKLGTLFFSVFMFAASLGMLLLVFLNTEGFLK